MLELHQIPANEFCESVRDGTHDSPKPVENGRYLVTSRHIIGDRIDLSKAYQISQGDFDEINRRSKVDRWDVLITMIGTVGDVCLVRDEPDFAIKNIGLFKSKDEVRGKWLYYYLKSPDAKSAIEAAKRGTTQAYIPLGELRRFPIWYPKDELKAAAITSYLSALDDKIELNRRMNETMEAMARAVFRDWFVDFGPTRAKMEGRPPYLSPTLWPLFPSHLTDQGIPEGWETRSVYEFAEVVYGAPFASKRFNSDGIGLPLIRIRDLASHEPGVSTDEVHKKGHLIKAGDIVVGMDGEFRLHIWKGPNAWLNQRVCHFEPKDGVPHSYLAEALNEPLAFFERGKVGTTVIHLGKSDIDTFELIHPGERLLQAFGEVVEPLIQQTVSNSLQSRALAQTRDLLLPKLLSGEIRLPDAEKTVEEVL